MPSFILEIGTEELPARFLESAQRDLTDKIELALSEKMLDFSGSYATSTPRRLVFFLQDLAAFAGLKEELILGPSLKAAYDVGGRPTQAALGFARSQKVALSDTFITETDRGQYLTVRKTRGGEAALILLSEICPRIIHSLSFPKKMRWGAEAVTFARPVRWILCLLGSQVVPFSVGSIKSENHTYGHRVHGPGPFILKEASDYFDLMSQQCNIVVDTKKRLHAIEQESMQLAAEKNGRILWKESLLNEVNGLCECPVPLLGSFNPDFLLMPREVLLTSMEEHQKSFGLETHDGNLLPYFLTVLNLFPEDQDLVRKGWERVLRARLEDAKFFWELDLKTGFAHWLESLDSVVFLANLGSMGEKTHRISQLAQWLTQDIQASKPDFQFTVEDAARAGRLSKADLVSAMVKEFDTLQGIMGGIYAAQAGETPAVAQAISEQYLPTGPDSPLPSSWGGALLAVADKADTLAGCFALGLIPSGAADPYALRRACLGIARIIIENAFRIDSSKLFEKALALYGLKQWKTLPEQICKMLNLFFIQRLKNYLVGQGYDTLLVEACLRSGSNDIWAVAKRVEALHELSETKAFTSMVFTFKRLVNIIQKQSEEEDETTNENYRPELLLEEAEKYLAEEFEKVLPLYDKLWDMDDFQGLFALLVPLHQAIEVFFNSVLVMCEETPIRQNRFRLLRAIAARLERLADFSAMQL